MLLTMSGKDSTLGGDEAYIKTCETFEQLNEEIKQL